jgi:hypothetical protein
MSARREISSRPGRLRRHGEAAANVGARRSYCANQVLNRSQQKFPNYKRDAHGPPPWFQFGRGGFFGLWIRCQRPLTAAVGDPEHQVAANRPELAASEGITEGGGYENGQSTLR